MHIEHLIEENQQHGSSIFFSRANLFKKRMKKFVTLITKEKQLRMNRKMMTLSSDFIQCIKKIRTILFLYLVVTSLEQSYISYVKSYKYMNKLISYSIKTRALAF